MPQQAGGREPAAGWMRDPSGRHFGRYWDGKQWTDHVISAGTVPSIDPVNQLNGEAVPTPAREARTEPVSTPERPGGWKPDPAGRHFSRYWDGGRWTEHVMSAERVPTIDPVSRRNLQPDRTEAPATAPTNVGPASGFRARARSAPWAIAVIVGGLIVIGVALSDRPPRPNKDGTNVTESVATTAPSAPAPLATTIPLTAQTTITVPGAPAGTGAPATTPATTPGTIPGSRSPGTGAPSVEPPPTVRPPGESSADPSMSTTS